MGKFVNLVKNEYIKLMLKASTWVMLIILLLASVGLSAMALIGQKQYETFSSSSAEDLFESYQSEINYLKDVKTEGWEQEVEYNQYLIDNAIENDWRINAAGTMFEIKYHAAEYGIADSDQLVYLADQLLMLAINHLISCYQAVIKFYLHFLILPGYCFSLCKADIPNLLRRFFIAADFVAVCFIFYRNSYVLSTRNSRILVF